MTTSEVRTTAPSAERPDLTPRVRTGLVIAVLLAIGGAVPVSGGPPLAVTVLGIVLAGIAIACVVWFWRTGTRRAVRILAGVLVLGAITSLPAFFVGGISPWLRVAAGATVVLSVVSIVLVFSRPKDAVLG